MGDLRGSRGREPTPRKLFSVCVSDSFPPLAHLPVFLKKRYNHLLDRCRGDAEAIRRCITEQCKREVVTDDEGVEGVEVFEHV